DVGLSLHDALPIYADVDVERNVVLEEIAMRDDDPEDLLFELFSSAVLGDHPLGRSILGTEESIANMTRSRVHGFYRSHYVMPKMVLAVAGKAQHQAVELLVSQVFMDRM